MTDRAVLLSQPAPGVTQLTLNRPTSLNAMNADLVDGLYDACDRLQDDRDTRVVVLTGAGRGFCSGADLRGYGAGGVDPGAPQTDAWASFAVQQRIAGLVPRLRRLHQPVIAAVNGPATGGGFALALGCDVRLAGPGAAFNVAFVKVALSGCDVGLSWLLPRLIGASRAWELMLTGRLIDADESERLGIVSRVVRDGDVVEAALDVAAEISANSAWGVRMTKEVAWSQLEVGSLQAGIDLENRTQILSTMSGDHVEAVRSFLALKGSSAAVP